jgi:8-oxo-dGTP diphosphatase
VSVRAFVHEEDQARAVAGRLRRDGFEAVVARERFAGEDDDEDRPWTVLTDAPPAMVEVLVDDLDGWVETLDEPRPPRAPLDLPDGPRRVKGHFRAP